ncbi:MAG: DNA-binding protein [Planctomycetota bacterium]|nr:MAG: DNA-binding protein [Planctomycetota bacterium]
MSTDQPTVNIVVLSATDLKVIATAYAHEIAREGAMGKSNPPPAVMNAGDVAAHFRVRRGSVIEALRSGALRGRREGFGPWRIDLADALSWLQQRDAAADISQTPVNKGAQP